MSCPRLPGTGECCGCWAAVAGLLLSAEPVGAREEWSRSSLVPCRFSQVLSGEAPPAQTARGCASLPSASLRLRSVRPGR
ncbi:Extracellular Matrix Protein 2 [Manis pentadactyla]|nr:Extracellular Matrix Protein 2 [Manis pentadactyla]